MHLPRVSDEDEEENKETLRSLRQDMEGESEDENEFFDTEDVDLELRNPRYDKTEKIRENESKVDIDFDVGILISGCLQRAEAMVRDSDTTSSGKNRKTERLNILLELLKESSTSEGLTWNVFFRLWIFLLFFL